MLITLEDAELAVVREMLEAEARDLRHEIHYTDKPEYKQELKVRLHTVEGLLGKLPGGAAGA